MVTPKHTTLDTILPQMWICRFDVTNYDSGLWKSFHDHGMVPKLGSFSETPFESQTVTAAHQESVTLQVSTPAPELQSAQN